jgi:hypothetical protein
MRAAKAFVSRTHEPQTTAQVSAPTTKTDITVEAKSQLKYIQEFHLMSAIVKRSKTSIDYHEVVGFDNKWR